MALRLVVGLLGFFLTGLSVPLRCRIGVAGVFGLTVVIDCDGVFGVGVVIDRDGVVGMIVVCIGVAGISAFIGVWMCMGQFDHPLQLAHPCISMDGYIQRVQVRDMYLTHRTTKGRRLTCGCVCFVLNVVTPFL